MPPSPCCKLKNTFVKQVLDYMRGCSQYDSICILYLYYCYTLNKFPSHPPLRTTMTAHHLPHCCVGEDLLMTVSTPEFSHHHLLVHTILAAVPSTALLKCTWEDRISPLKDMVEKSSTAHIKTARDLLRRPPRHISTGP